MKITILTAGSRGDVQPFVALGVGLQQAGHEVTVCTSESFEPFITRHNLNYAYMNDELIKLGETPEGRAAMDKGGNPLGLIKRVKPIIRRMLDDEWQAAQGAETLVYHPKALGGVHLAEKLGIAAFLSLPSPLYTPTRAFANPLFGGANLGRLFNRLSYKMTALAQAPFMGVVNEWRRDVLQLPARSRFANELIRSDGRPVPVLYSYSEHVVPRPDDWPAEVAVTGYWFLEEAPGWQPPDALAAFLASGSPPVYVGFGSIAGRNPEKVTQTVLEALAISGQRGLLATGWGGLSPANLPETVFVIKEAPHEWLLPRVAAVVHHGGAGTTAAGLRAGKPSIICPFFGDQLFWGNRVARLGVGPEAIRQKKLTAVALGEAIVAATTDTSLRRRAEALGAQIRGEEGVARAVEIITPGRLSTPAPHPETHRARP